MDANTCQTRPLYHWCARMFLAWFAGLFATLTVVTHTAQLLGWSFRLFAWTSLLVILGGTAAIGVQARRSWQCSRPAPDGPATPLALLLVLIAALVALFSFRVNTDDYYYVPNAVHALANPGEPLGFTVHGLIPEGDEPVVSYNYSTSLPFEYLPAVLAYFVGFEYLSGYYYVMPMLAAAIMIAALLLLCGQFRAPPLMVVLGCAIALSLLLLMGETHRAFGNFSLTRAFHGKALVLSGGIPLLAASTIEFFRQPSRWSWLPVLAVTTAMVGVSTTAIVILPLLAVVLALALGLALGGGLTLLRTIGLYGVAFVYPVGYALAYLATGYPAGLGSESLVNIGYPTDFIGQLWLVVERSAPFWPFLLLAGAASFFGFARGRDRKLLAYWFLGSIVLYLNPLTAPFWIEHVTSPNLYWRVFYLLPVLPVIALGSALALERLGRFRYMAAGAILLPAIAAHWILPAVSVFNIAVLGPPRYNLPADSLADAREIIAAAPPGSMLAPTDIGGIVPMLRDGYPQILRRRCAEWLWLDGGSSGQITMRRLVAAEFAGGRSRDANTFLRVVDQLRPESIVLRSAAEESLGEQGRRILSSMGYRTELRGDDWLVLARY